METLKRIYSTNEPWAWVCIIGALISNIMTIGTLKIVGIVYVEAMETFNASAGEASLIFMTFGIAYTVTPLLGAWISDRFSNRVAVCLGSLLLVVGFTIASYATHINHVIFGYGPITGVGIALSLPGTQSFIGKIFVDYRSLAVGLSVSGGSLSQFINPLLIRYLFDKYTFSGGMLIYGAVMLNICIGGSMFRPELDKGRKKVPQSIEEKMVFIEEKDTSAEKMNTDIYKVENKSRKKNGSTYTSIDTKDNGHCLKGKCSSVDLSVLKEPFYVLYIVGTCLALNGYASVFLLLPPQAKRIGISKQETAQLLIYIGAGDLVGRLSSGFIADISFIKRNLKIHHIYLFCIAICGTAIICCPFLESFGNLVAFGFVYGLFGGGFITQMVVVLAEYVGAKRLNVGNGINTFMIGIGRSVTPVVVGQMRDLTGSYTAPFIHIGCMMLTAALIFLIGPITISYLQKRSKKLPKSHIDDC